MCRGLNYRPDCYSSRAVTHAKNVVSRFALRGNLIVSVFNDAATAGLQHRSPSHCSRSNFVLDDCKSTNTELLQDWTVVSVNNLPKSTTPHSQHHSLCSKPLLHIRSTLARRGSFNYRTSIHCSVCLVCPINRQQRRRPAGLLLSASVCSRHRSILRAWCFRRQRSTANAGSVMLSSTQPCNTSNRNVLNTQEFLY